MDDESKLSRFFQNLPGVNGRETAQVVMLGVGVGLILISILILASGTKTEEIQYSPSPEELKTLVPQHIQEWRKSGQ